MDRVWYATREQVKASVEVSNSYRANRLIDRALADASDSADRLCRRVFYPRYAERKFDWPNEDSPTPGRLWLGGQSELLELTYLESGGSVISLANVLLYPTSGPPYDRIELDQSASATFESGPTTQQTGLFRGLLGSAPDRQVDVASVSAGGIGSADTTISVTDGSLIGVGSLLKIETERLIVTERMPLAAPGTLAAPGLTAEQRSITVPLSSATLAPEPGETILIDGERMMVQDRTGTNVYVTRAVDGSVLAAHTAGAAVYTYRSLRVTRGAVGTTAAAHTADTTITAYEPPSSVNGLVVAEALNQVAQENAAYARVIGSGENQREARGAGLADKRKRVRTELGRRVRMGAV